MISLEQPINGASDSFLPKAAACIPVIGGVISTLNINALISTASDRPEGYNFLHDAAKADILVVVKDFRIASLVRNFICIAALVTLIGLGIIHGTVPLLATGGGITVFAAMNVRQALKLHTESEEVERLRTC